MEQRIHGHFRETQCIVVILEKFVAFVVKIAKISSPPPPPHTGAAASSTRGVGEQQCQHGDPGPRWHRLAATVEKRKGLTPSSTPFLIFPAPELLRWRGAPTEGCCPGDGSGGSRPWSGRCEPRSGRFISSAPRLMECSFIIYSTSWYRFM
jgi:hypothetical protein